MSALAGLLAKYGVPSLGVFLSTSIYASSFPDVRRARILRNMDHLDAVTLTMQFLNAQAWLEFARVVHDPFIWTANITGAALTTFYIATVLELAVANGKLATRGKVEVIFAVGMAYMVLLNMANSFIVTSSTLQATIAGYTANVLGVLMCLAPALNIWRAVKERSAVCIQIPLNIASLVCNAVWTVYGLFVKHDPFIWVGCSIALVSAVAQLTVVLVFLKSDAAKRKDLAKAQSLQKLKASAIQQHYEQRYQKDSVYLPLEFHSEYLAERLQMRAETGQKLCDPERHETTATALMGVEIHPELADVVLMDLAKENPELAVVVHPAGEAGSDVEAPCTPTSKPKSPKTPTSKPHIQASEAVQQIVQTLQQVSHVECRKLTQDEEAPKHVFKVSIKPRQEDEEALIQPPATGSRLSNTVPEPDSPYPTIELKLGKKSRFTLSCASLPDLHLLAGIKPADDFQGEDIV